MSETSRRKIMLMAGGTGGHIFPALAVARLLQAEGVAVEWLGSAASMEAEKVPQAGLPFHALSISGLRGKKGLALLLAPFRLLNSIWQALRILRQTRPDAVVGFGGFASGPGGLAASLLRIPLYLHEQNALPGMTNRYLSRVARRVFTGFPDVLMQHPMAVWVGNPVRAELTQLPPPHERYAARQGPLRLLVVGGSLGAQAFNETLPQALALLSLEQRPLVRHQTGARKDQATRSAYAANQLEEPLELSCFIQDMAEALSWADLVLCRAGALTISELAAVGVASVLVPYPFAVDDHQTHNARLLVDAGAAVLMPQTELNAESLARLLNQTLNDRQSLADMANQAYGLARPQAGEALVQLLLKDIS